MIQFRADLHCHSTCSDGTATPEQLIDLAVKNELSGLSITDHDTVQAYQTALPYAKNRNIQLLSGIEFSCDHRGISVHILGYAFSLTNQPLLDFCLKHKNRRETRYQQILEKLNEHGMPIDSATFGKGSIGRPHIAMAMIEKGYVSSVQEAFRTYLANNKPCYVPGETFSVEETIEIIHQAGGFAVIAHPHLIQESYIVTDLLRMPFDGLEGYYARFAPHQERRWLQIANHRQWLITGGSDFHGDIKTHIPLGCSWVSETTFKPLYDHFQQHAV